MAQQEQTNAKMIGAPLYLYAETPLHAGVDFDKNAPVDLPIQREAVTGYPIVRSSTLKGSLRAVVRGAATSEEVVALFGSEVKDDGQSDQNEAQDDPEAQMASLVIGDAQL
ncbi:MAG: RAMP superfamily CRISPR-associated protein, partial [Caldilinea sp.]